MVFYITGNLLYYVYEESGCFIFILFIFLLRHSGFKRTTTGDKTIHWRRSTSFLACFRRESIKSYLKTLYTQPVEDVAPPSFLLIVGDVEHIPLSQISTIPSIATQRSLPSQCNRESHNPLRHHKWSLYHCQKR